MLLLLLINAIGASSAAPAGSNTIYVIRHGEKTSVVGCLNGAGEARAAALVDIFNGEASTRHETFGTPKSIFANNYDDHIDCERCTQTVKPIATGNSLITDGSPLTGFLHLPCRCSS